jgi:outer membrane biosynthesis protein TonB
MRLAIGAGGLAAFSALATAIVLPPRPAYQAPVAVLQQSADAGSPAGSGRPVLYVQLLPGQTAPPGASVIPATVPTSGTLVVTVPAPGKKPAAQNPPPKQVAQQPAPQPVAQATPAPKPKPAPTPIIVKTTQSGVVVP